MVKIPYIKPSSPFAENPTGSLYTPLQGVLTMAHIRSANTCRFHRCSALGKVFLDGSPWSQSRSRLLLRSWMSSGAARPTLVDTGLHRLGNHSKQKSFAAIEQHKEKILPLKRAMCKGNALRAPVASSANLGAVCCT